MRYIGTSGFSYQHWKGVFYPEGLSQRRWLEYYRQFFNSVELNAPFYRLPGEKTVRGWHDRVSGEFRYAVKLSRYITHMKHLREVDEPLALFLSRIRLLGEFLGPILVQLPPGLHLDPQRLDDFLDRCDPALHWAVEFRHASWLTDAVYEVLRRHQAALCIHDIIPEHPRVVTAPFLYVRFHGYDSLYGGDYPDGVLREWAVQLRAWEAQGLDTFAYFNNDAGGMAVKNARTLQGLAEAG